jgi:hypothetical protein
MALADDLARSPPSRSPLSRWSLSLAALTLAALTLVALTLAARMLTNTSGESLLKTFPHAAVAHSIC